jgi:hypothetical protein
MCVGNSTHLFTTNLTAQPGATGTNVCILHYYPEALGTVTHEIEYDCYLPSHTIIAISWKDGDKSLKNINEKQRIGIQMLGQYRIEPLVQHCWYQLPTIPFLHWLIEQLVALHNAMKVGTIRGVPAHLQIMC